MNLEKKIIHHIHELPESKKAQVLDFIEYLMNKADDADCAGFSLSSAMRGMEEEPSPYSLEDLKESFS